MKSKSTPWTHTAVTADTVQATVDGGSFKYDITVPKGTLCRKRGPGQWVVGDLGFIEDKRSILYSDADIYGIRVNEEKLTDIKEVGSR